MKNKSKPISSIENELKEKLAKQEALLNEVKSFLKKKFEEQPLLEWVEFEINWDYPQFVNLTCKLEGYDNPKDIETLPRNLELWVVYCDDDMAGIIRTEEDTNLFHGIKVTRESINRDFPN